LGLVALLLASGCRSTTTDRIRVLEAQKADAERRVDDMTHEMALARSREIELEGLVKSERARADALQSQVEMLRDAMAKQPQEPQLPTVDANALADRLRGTGVEVAPGENGGAKITLASDVTFRAGRADLNKKAISTLDRVAKALIETQGVRSVRVEGHTDSDPIVKSGWRDNEHLSLERAKVVRNYLVSRGIKGNLLEVDGHGAEQPVASNDDKDGKARNRRVEIILVARDE
jgi:flagellar motor protein MotB